MSVSVGNAYGEIVLDSQGVKQGVDGALGQIDRLGAGVNRIGGMMAGVITGAAAVLAGGTAAFVASSTQIAATLEEQMSGIRAVMGATADQVGQLNDLILDLGIDPTLKVSALEAASAIESLGRNGLEVEEILDGAARATVLLANATGGEFAAAADVATSVMDLWGIAAGDMETAVDGITATVNSSRLEFEDYAMALAQGGGVAAQAGVSFEDFNVAIAAISPAFASGSDAGTSFKAMIQRLIPQSEEAEDTMRDLGLITADGSNAFFDASGNMKSMAEIAGILNDALYGTSTVMTEVGGRTAAQNTELERLRDVYARTQQSLADYEAGIKGAGMSEDARARKLEELRTQLANIQAAMDPLLAIQGDLIESTRTLTEEERLAAMTIIFGADAVRAAGKLAEVGSEEFLELAAAMSEVSAADMAAIRMDNLRGSIEILTGVIDTLKIRVGNVLLGYLKTATDTAAEFVSENSDRIVGAFERVADFAEQQIPRAIAIASDYFNNTLRPALVNTWGYIQNTVIPIALILQGWLQEQLPKAIQFLRDHWEELKGSLVAVGGLLVLSGIFSGIAAVIATLTSPIALLIGAVALLGAAWAGNWFNIQGIVQTAVAYIQGVLLDLQTWWQQNDEMVIGLANTIWSQLLPGLQQLATWGQQIAATVLPLLAQGWQWVIDNLNIVLPILAAAGAVVLALTYPLGLLVAGVVGLATAWANNWGNIQGLTQRAVAYLQGVLTTFQTWWGEHGLTIQAVVLTAWTVVRDTILAVGDVLVNQVFPHLREAFDNITATLQGTGISWSEVWSAIGTAVSIVAAAIGAILLALIGAVVGLVNGVAAALENWIGAWTRAKNAVFMIFDNLIEAFSHLVGYFQALINGDWQGMLHHAGALFKLAFENIILALSIAYSFLDMTFGSILSLIGGFVEGFIGFFRSLYDRLVGHSIIPDLVRDMVAAFTSVNWGQIGADIVSGLANAIAAGTGAVAAAARQLAEAAWNELVDFWEDHSPSRRTMRMGVDIVDGLIIGTQSMAAELASTFAQLGQDTMDRLEAAAQSRSGRVVETMTGIGKMMGDALTAAIAAGAEDAQALIDNLLSTAGGLSGIGGDLASMFEDQTVDPLRDLLEQREDQIEQNMAFLEDAFERTGAQSLADLVIAKAHGLLTEDEIAALTVALSLQQARNEAAQELAEAEQRILELREQQQKLDFLQTQFELLELLQEHGLNAAEILGGMELGLNASVEDLLAAMTAAMQAIIGQAEDELGIASPSTVFKALGEQINRGLALGIGDLGLVDNAMDELMGSILPQPVAAASSRSYDQSSHLHGNINQYYSVPKKSALEEILDTGLNF